MPALTAQTAVPFVTVTNWVRSAALCGFNIEPLLREVGIDTRHLHPDHSAIHVLSLLTLMQRCVDESRRQRAGLHFPVVLGESFAFDYLSDVETFITTSPTLRDAQPALQWLPALINPFMHLALQEHGPQARLVLSYPTDSPDDTWHVTESVLVTFCKFSRILLGEAWVNGEVTVRHQAQPGSDQFATFMAMPVRFGQPLNALWFDRALLDRPLRGALPGLHESAAQRVAAQLAQRQSGEPVDGLALQLESLLRSRPDLLGQGLHTLAHALSLHPRTLQRRLRAESVQHSAIVARVRHDLACQWLTQTDDSIEDISVRLGFSDRRSFTQAFTRWTGTTPSEHRRQGKP